MGFTFIDAVAMLAPTCAFTITSPSESVATTPSDETVAIDGSELDQTTVVAASVASPNGDVATTLKFSVSPRNACTPPGTTLNGASCVDATAKIAVSATWPTFATIFAEPAPMAVTRPLLVTVAMAASVDRHETALSVTTRPSCVT